MSARIGRSASGASDFAAPRPASGSRSGSASERAALVIAVDQSMGLDYASYKESAVNPRIPVDPKDCATCGKPLVRKRFNGRLEDRSAFGRRKYCDRQCMAIGKIKEDVTVAALHQRARKFCREACERCGTHEWLSVHHKNHDPADNGSRNLMTLCRSCHTTWHWEHGKVMPKRADLGTCSECDRPARRLRWCRKHYERFERHGNPRLVKVKRGSGFALIEKD